jgi:uncharacterized protein (UPF0264 family)
MNERIERFLSVALEKGLREAHREVDLTDDEIDRVVELAAEVLGLSGAAEVIHGAESRS